MDNNALIMQIAEVMEKQSTELKIFIENTVTKRIDSLFDGYQLTHEKQWALERRTEQLQQELQELQARLTIIESKIA